jgi:hypothetical protein
LPNTLKDLERALANLPKIVNTAKKTAISSAMFHLQQSTKEWIETGGQGTWEDRASLSKRLVTGVRGAKKGKWRKANSKQRKAGPLARYARYPRYRENFQNYLETQCPRFKKSAHTQWINKHR